MFRGTRRAANPWAIAKDAQVGVGAFYGIFLASGLYWSQAESTCRAIAGNAHRWAANDDIRQLQKY